jgi:hypothetical protein
MRVVTLSRKRCRASSTTANVVEHEAGALNIDATRIGFQSQQDKDAAFPGGTTTSRQVVGGGLGAGWREHDRGDFSAQQHSAGRWPANVVLVHRTACEQGGTTVVPGYTINRWTDGAKPFGGGAGHEYESDAQPDEEIIVWDCSSTCSVSVLDEAEPLSRYFKQVQENAMNEIPAELIDYLVTMISPPPSCEPNIIVRPDFDDYPWERHEDASVHGILTMGNPEPYMEDIDRVLRPGAHLLIVSPEDEPTGHTGACAVEDFGYEIRDAIAVLDAPGEFHYVAKASSAERNAGIVARESESGRVVQNDHPTIKPVAIMKALLADVPAGALVVDPFMGSGTTGVACLRTGHNFVGIDQDAQYLQIADQRVRHWDRAKNAWNGATIESEAQFEEEEPVGLEDLFGFGGEDEESSPVGDCPVCEQRDVQVEIKEAGERLEVCETCAGNRTRVRLYLREQAEARVQELEE